MVLYLVVSLNEISCELISSKKEFRVFLSLHTIFFMACPVSSSCPVLSSCPASKSFRDLSFHYLLLQYNPHPNYIPSLMFVHVGVDCCLVSLSQKGKVLPC